MPAWLQGGKRRRREGGLLVRVWTTARTPRWSCQRSKAVRKDWFQPACYFRCSLQIDWGYLFSARDEVISLTSRTSRCDLGAWSSTLFSPFPRPDKDLTISRESARFVCCFCLTGHMNWPALVSAGETERTRDQLLLPGCFHSCGLLGSPVTAMPLAKGGRGGRQRIKRRE